VREALSTALSRILVIGTLGYPSAADERDLRLHHPSFPRHGGPVRRARRDCDGLRRRAVAHLICEDNDPPPTGSGNTVEGNREGQCAGL
jgi:hypothetical protein